MTAYLSPEAITATLEALPRCTLAVAYLTPEETWDGDSRSAGQVMQELALQSGEPIVSFFTPDEFAGVLREAGFTVVDDVGAEDVEARYGLPAVATGGDRIALAEHSG